MSNNPNGAQEHPPPRPPAPPPPTPQLHFLPTLPGLNMCSLSLHLSHLSLSLSNHLSLSSPLSRSLFLSISFILWLLPFLSRSLSVSLSLSHKDHTHTCGFAHEKHTQTPTPTHTPYLLYLTPPPTFCLLSLFLPIYDFEVQTERGEKCPSTYGAN